MADIFRVYLGSENGRETFLNLPAMPWALLDAQEKLRLSGSKAPYLSIEEYCRFDSLGHILEGDCSLGELNALAQKLSELDDVQSIAFEGLLQMEGGRAGLPRIVDLAYSTDCCHVVEEALNDAQLGRFCAENGFVPKTEDLPDELFDLLDFRRIGREHRQREGGVLVERSADHPGGYVERHSELAQVYKTMDLTLKEPDYTILLEAAKGFFNDPDYDSDRTVQLRLPAEPEELDAALDKLGAWDWREAGWRCLDCRVPALADAITGCDEDIHMVNRFAQTLADMEPERLTACKALLEAAGCRELREAALLADGLDQYLFTPQLASPTQVAQDELSNLLDDGAIELLLPHLNLCQYGQALVRDCGGVLTSYGFIERKDGQSIQRMEEAPKRGGMEVS